MTNYTNIKSKYVKDKIKNLKMTDKNMCYINDLIDIECANTGGLYGLWSGHKRRALKHKYQKEWDAIGIELNPKHITIKQEEEERAKELKKRDEKLKRDGEIDREESVKTWKIAGGG